MPATESYGAHSANLTEAAVRTEYVLALDRALNTMGGERPEMLLVQDVPETKHDGKFPILGAMPDMKPFISERTIQGLSSYKISYSMLKYELTIGIEEDLLHYDRIGAFRSRLDQIAMAKVRDTSRKIQQLLSAMLAAGTNASYLACDGQYFFDTDHVLGAQTSYSNYLATALTYDNLWAAILALEAVTDDTGNKIGQKATHLFYASNLEKTAIEITTGTYVPGSANLTTNTLRQRVIPVQLPLLTSSYWMVAALEPGNPKPLLYLHDDTLETDPRIFNPANSMQAAMTDDWFFMVKERKAIVPAWHCSIIGSDGS